MADLVNRAQMRKELPRLSGQAFIQSQEVLTSSFRRIGAGDYRLAVDDVALLAAINSFAAQEKTEDDETQTKLDTINASLGTINTSITTLNANLTTLLNEVKTALGGIDASIDETTAAVNDVNEDTESIDAKMDTANTHLAKLDPIQDDVEAIRDNTTPVVVGVELTGLEGLDPFTEEPYDMSITRTTGAWLPYDMSERGWTGYKIMSNGERVALTGDDFAADKFSLVQSNSGSSPFVFADNGDISLDCSVYDDGEAQIRYTYSDGISTDIYIASRTGTFYDNVTQSGIDLAHIQVGQTIDFTVSDLIGIADGKEAIIPSTNEQICTPNKTTIAVSWESSNNDVLTKTEDGKFNAAKAGTSTITYKLYDPRFEQNPPKATGTFNAVVEAPFPEITLFNGGQVFSTDGSNTFTVNMLDNPNSNRYRIKQDGSFLSGSATADGTVLQVAGSENDDLKTLQTGSGTFSIAYSGQTKQFNVNVTGNTESSPKVLLVTGDTSSRSESFDLGDSPTVNISNGEVYTGEVYIRNATASQFSGSVSSSIASGTLLTSFDFDRDTVAINSGNYGILTFTAIAKDPASSSDSSVVNVSIGDNEYTINFAFSE